jgi:hypothetical protein
MPLFAGSGATFYIMSDGRMQGEAASAAKQMEAITEQAVIRQSALQANYIVNYTAVQVGNQMQISGTVMTSGGQVVAKNVITVPRNTGSTDAMHGLAQLLVRSLGSAGPKCGSGSGQVRSRW